MKYPRNTVAVCLLAALAGFAGVASAQDAKTRAQVESELSAAMASGDMLSPSGIPYRVLRPDLYPTAHAGGKSRAQVEAELASAMRNGDMLAPGELGLAENQLEPQFYAHRGGANPPANLATSGYAGPGLLWFR
jgi:hypothetical protein